MTWSEISGLLEETNQLRQGKEKDAHNLGTAKKGGTAKYLEFISQVAS